jgi:GAF domain-containing protein
VAASGQPLVVEDVAEDPRFAADEARKTGYVPKGLMAVPLLREDRVLGVLNVLDRPERRRFSVAEMDLLGLFADQAAVALELLLQARRIDALLGASGDPLEAVARLAMRIDQLDGAQREAGMRLIEDLAEIFADHHV